MSTRRPSASRSSSRLAGAGLRELGLAPEADDEPADDQADDHLAARLEGDEIRAEGVVAARRTQTLELDQHRHGGYGEEQRGEDAEPDGGFGHREVEHLPNRTTAVEVVDEQIGRKDRGVERERAEGESELSRARQVESAENEQGGRAERECEGDEPRVALVTRRVTRAEDDLQDGEDDASRAHVCDPALGLPQVLELGHHARSSIRPRAHDASSPSAGSSSSRRTRSRCSGPPVLPSAMSAFRLR